MTRASRDCATIKPMPTKKVVPKKRVAVRKGGAKKIEVTDIEDLEITQPAAVPLIMYRRIALTFIVLVAAALLAVLYLSTVQAVIHVDSTEEPITTEFVANVYEVPTRATDVRGAVVSGMLGRTQTFEPTGDSLEDRRGYRSRDRDDHQQSDFRPVARRHDSILVESGVLFRLEDSVSIPAGGSVKAEVYADVAGESGNIQPTRFSIPGLSETRQASVYATSAEAFTGGIYSVAVVSQEELDMAATQLETALLEDAKAMLIAEVDETFTGQSYDVEVVEKHSPSNLTLRHRASM